MKKNKYVCIHGHFYQPPRENAWLGEVELQDSAAPFHDWNERINFECYAPNTAARILDQDQKITEIFSNYARISFNFGPTLLSWLEENDPNTYQSILDADKKSIQYFGGHGSALAQAHSHLIVPLANSKDKETQISWGIADFEHRFGRAPEGMWLSETAVDTESLEIMAEYGIKFTILAPRQAKAIRKIGDEQWSDLAPETVDPRRPYLCKLPSGREIVLFFYHGGIAQSVAFERLLNDGKAFAAKFFEVFDDNEMPQLAHIATDGESYGHHHRHGEMALASCLKEIQNAPDITLINYGQYLDLYPLEYEIQIHENSSWSCVHGVERWRNNCGCNTGGNHGWDQAWRKPLRDTLNWLRDELIPIFLQEAEALLHKPWEARNDYIQVILDRSEENIDRFLERQAKMPLTEDQKIKLLRLMEMQRNAILMFTSCGWFFDEISGIETDQILQYANRAIHYALQVGNVYLHDSFIRKLEEIPSNVYQNGAISYKDNVIPANVDLVRVGMHIAASSLFEAYPEELEIFNYKAYSKDFIRHEAGIQKLAVGRTTVHSKITHSKKDFSFAVLHLGQQNIIGNISINMEEATFKQMSEEIVSAFEGVNLGRVIGLMQEHFGPDKFSIWHLFRDEKRKIIKEITAKSVIKLSTNLRTFYQDNYQLMTGMLQSEIPVPKEFLDSTEIILNKDLVDFFEQKDLHLNSLKRIASEFKKWKIQLNNKDELSFVSGERIYKELQKILAAGQQTQAPLKRLNNILETLNSMAIEIDLWKSQNLYFSMLRTYKKMEESQRNPRWEKLFYNLGALLGVKTP